MIVLGLIGKEIRGLVVLALPLALAQVVQQGMQFVDTLMVGRLGGEQLAAMALGATILMFTVVFLQGVIFSVGPTVAQAYGAGDLEDVGRTAKHGLWLALLLALPAMFLLYRAEYLLLAMGQNPDTAALAGEYLQGASWGILPLLLLVANRSFLEGIGDTRSILYLMIAGLAANVVLNEALIFGRWGFPRLEVAGAGYATAAVQLIMMVLSVAYVNWQQGRFGVYRGRFLPEPRRLWQLACLGAPIGLTLGFEAGLFSVTALLMGLVGELELASHQIAIQSSSMTFTIAVGLAVAASVRVGQAVGRQEHQRARIAGAVGIVMSALIMAGSASVFLLAPEAVIGIYIDRSDPLNAGIGQTAALFLGIAATFQIFDGIQVSTAGVLRGYKDTSVPMVISLVSYWLVGLGSGYLLAFHLGWGGRGLWTGLVLGLATAAILLLWRFVWRSSGKRLIGGRMTLIGRRP